MTSDQLSEAMYLIVMLVGVAWRWYVSTRKNTPAATRVRLTNGHADSSSKIDTGEWKRFIDREYALDKSRDAQIEVHDRNLSILNERFFNSQDRLIDFERRLLKLESSFEETLKTLARIEASQAGVNHLLESIRS